MSSSTIATIIHGHCDAAIAAIQKLEVVKQILSDYEADSQRLEKEVRGLQIEKEALSQEIVEMKKQLQDLGNELTEAQDHVLAHVYTTGAPDDDYEFGENEEGSCFQESTLISDGGENEEEPVSAPHCMFDIIMPGDSSVVDSSAATSVSSTSTNTSSCSSSSSSVVHKKRRRSSSKWYKSPKKWRRMMRTHRLQSILLD